MPMLIAMLDGLRQSERFWHDQRGTSPLARAHRLAPGAHQDAPIAVPAITQPRERPLVSPLDGAGQRALKQAFAQRTGGAGHNEATVAVLNQASPALSLVWLGSCAL